MTGRSSVRTSALDVDLNALVAGINHLISNLTSIQRYDNLLADSSVWVGALAPDVIALIGSPGFRLHNPLLWATATAYLAGDIVVNDSKTLVAAVSHTSGTFATDIATGKWATLYDTSGFVFTPTPTIGATTVQTAIVEVDTELRNFIQSGTGTYVSAVGGTANAIVLSPGSAIAGYAAGQRLYFVATSTNTAAVTVSVSGLAAKSVVSVGGVALSGGEIVPGLVSIVYDGTNFQVETMPAFQQGAAGAVLRSLQSKAADIVSRDDFSSLAHMWAASLYKPKFDISTGKAWFNSDASALDYSTTRAGLVVQQRDAAAGAANTLIPNCVFQFNVTGDGNVTAGSELSTTIWMGLFAYMKKTGDGSGHTFTSIGELGAYGAGGYSELGLFEGEATNTGSLLGTISGVEILIKDSPDAGVNSYSTKLSGVVSRVNKYNATVRKANNFLAESGGSQAPDAILGVSLGGSKTWRRAFDFQGAIFSTGEVMLSPNNTFLSWLTTGAAAKPLIGLSSADNTVLAAPAAGKSIQLTTNTFSTGLLVTDDATNRVAIFVGGTLLTIGVGVANSGGAGNRALIVPN